MPARQPPAQRHLVTLVTKQLSSIFRARAPSVPPPSLYQIRKGLARLASNPPNSQHGRPPNDSCCTRVGRSLTPRTHRRPRSVCTVSRRHVSAPSTAITPRLRDGERVERRAISAARNRRGLIKPAQGPAEYSKSPFAAALSPTFIATRVEWPAVKRHNDLIRFVML